jgi:hypothetical protein
MHLWDGEREVTVCSQEHRNEYEATHGVALKPLSDAVDETLRSLEADHLTQGEGA